MRLFVHTNYGINDVYPADTDEDRKYIFMSLYEILRDFQIEEMYPEAEIPLTRFTERDIYNLLDAFGIGTHEIIEYGTGFANLKTRSN